MKQKTILGVAAIPLVACCMTCAAYDGKWENITSNLLAVTTNASKIGNVGVDRANGALYVVVHGEGLYKSTDKGTTFARVKSSKVTAAGVNSYSFDFDPEGKRMAFFGMYGSHGLTLDGGETWIDIRAGDWGCVDWSDPLAKTMIGAPHGPDRLFIATDYGKATRPFNEAFASVGIFDSQTYCGYLADAIFRSEDGGKTSVKVSTSGVAPFSHTCVRMFMGAAYWVSPRGVLLSYDKGKSWRVLGSPAPDTLIAGPFFGKDEMNIVVVGKSHIYETKNSGGKWVDVAPSQALPEWARDENETKGCLYYAWDAANDVFYVGKFHDSVHRFVRRQAGK